MTAMNERYRAEIHQCLCLINFYLKTENGPFQANNSLVGELINILKYSILYYYVLYYILYILY